MLVHRVKDLKPAIRAAIEAEFGRPLRDDEEVSIAASPAGESSEEGTRAAALLWLEAYYARMDEKTKDIPEQEIEQILHEAIRSVRPHYEEHHSKSPLIATFWYGQPAVRGAARKLILHLASTDSLILSSYILEEVGRTLFYPRLAKRFDCRLPK